MVRRQWTTHHHAQRNAPPAVWSTVAEQCRFRDCQHQSEPGCAIQAAIEEGTLSAKRLNSYQKLQREQAYQNRRQDKQAQSNAKARWKKITKAIRQKQQN
ncbi:MAG: hypothetical protein AAFQ95_05675 [Cyanobacteria bacterium J06621_3]